MKAPKKFDFESIYSRSLDELKKHCEDWEKYIAYSSSLIVIDTETGRLKPPVKYFNQITYFEVVTGILKSISEGAVFDGDEYESDWEELMDCLESIQEHQFEIQDLQRLIIKLSDELSEDPLDSHISETINQLEKLKKSEYENLKNTITYVRDMNMDINLKKIGINLFGLGKHIM